ncbi:calcium-binding protein [Inquilinus sp. CA228]|uniref:calcium-binding protein n=1 Tax=Inquilinus sp. CA228 TaxID=3455609 RepID=UPI003F8D131F
MGTFIGTENFDHLVGGLDDDFIDGNGGDDHLEGSDGNDTIFGGAGDDRIDADDGDDQVIGEEGDDTIFAFDGNDRLRGDRGSDQINGGDGSDALDGGQGDDRLDGEEGNDILVGGEGADRLSGSEGADILSGDRSPDGGIPPVGQLATDLFRWSAIDGNDDDRILDFFPGVDILQFQFCSEFATVQALLATVGGNAVLSVSRGGGIATLTLEGVAASALAARDIDLLVSSSDGPTIVTGAAGADDLFGQFGNDVLSGAAGNDRLFGEQDGDTLDGGSGDDRLFGGGGNDILRGSTGVDRLDGGGGVDLASWFTGSAGVAVSLATGTGSGGDAQGDILTGIENLSGSQGNDSLVGNAGANVLQGWSGSDVLTGSGGKDTLTGGAGADRFVYSSAAQSAVGANADRITDFSRAQGDRIDLSAIDARTTVAGDQGFTFIGSAPYHKVAGELRFAVTSPGVTTIAGDVNGDGVSDFHIVLIGAVALQATDFAL